MKKIFIILYLALVTKSAYEISFNYNDILHISEGVNNIKWDIIVNIPFIMIVLIWLIIALLYRLKLFGKVIPILCYSSSIISLSLFIIGGVLLFNNGISLIGFTEVTLFASASLYLLTSIYYLRPEFSIENWNKVSNSVPTHNELTSNYKGEWQEISMDDLLTDEVLSNKRLVTYDYSSLFRSINFKLITEDRKLDFKNLFDLITITKSKTLLISATNGSGKTVMIDNLMYKLETLPEEERWRILNIKLWEYCDNDSLILMLLQKLFKGDYFTSKYSAKVRRILSKWKNSTSSKSLNNKSFIIDDLKKIFIEGDNNPREAMNAFKQNTVIFIDEIERIDWNISKDLIELVNILFCNTNFVKEVKFVFASDADVVLSMISDELCVDSSSQIPPAYLRKYFDRVYHLNNQCMFKKYINRHYPGIVSVEMIHNLYDFKISRRFYNLIKSFNYGGDKNSLLNSRRFTSTIDQKNFEELDRILSSRSKDLSNESNVILNKFIEQNNAGKQIQGDVLMGHLGDLLQWLVAELIYNAKLKEPAKHINIMTLVHDFIKKQKSMVIIASMDMGHPLFIVYDDYMKFMKKLIKFNENEI